MKRDGDITNNYKIGQTQNFVNTRRCYERSGNVKMKFYEVDFFKMNVIEALILNILIPYRIKKTDSNCLTEVVIFEIKLLKIIIKWCIDNIYLYDLTNIKRCASINTMTDHRNAIDKYIWTDLCCYLINFVSINYCIPMIISTSDDINCNYSYCMSFVDFDNCINLLK